MLWVSLVAVFILVASLLSGLKEGAAKHVANLVATLIGVYVAGRSYHLVAGLLHFISSENWQNFLGFFIALAVSVAILYLVFLAPRKLTEVVWRRGLLSRLLGGAISVVDAGIGLAVFALVLTAFPVFDWLARWVGGSGVMASLVRTFSFVQQLLPEVFRAAATRILGS
ncbi:MAG: CvpA family protein [Chloroflexi bacterium]|nr:CvpA family protein [Chloroflexota bacterium]